ncbi:MAG: hypothetical protein ACI4XJ_06550 [Eubacteriales bacterium]
MNTRKTLALLLAALMLLTPLSSCGEKKDAGSETGNKNETAAENAEIANTQETEEENVDPLANLPVIDYEGHNFTYLIRNFPDWINDMVAEDLSGEVVNDAIFRRNSETAERYNITISHKLSSNSNSEMDAKPVILAGEDAYDLVIPHGRAAHAYANEGLVLDWNDLKYVDLTQSWWDADAVRSFTLPGGLFCMTGDISYQSLGACNAMLFNKDYFDEYHLEYPYETVKEGGWTFDYFTSMVEGYSRDLDGDGVLGDGDIYGYGTFHWVGPVQAFFTAGGRVIDKIDGEYTFNVYNERTINMFERYFALYDSANVWKVPQSVVQNGATSEMFRKGGMLFADMNITEVVALRDMDYSFGILPWPKFDESSEYLSNVDAGVNLFVVPITASDPDRTSLIIETLCILGREYVIPAYYDVALKTRDSRDEKSSAMLDIIREHRVFDLGYYNEQMGGTLANHFADMATSGNRDFASWYKQKEKVASKQMEKVIKTYEKRAEEAENE